MGFTEPIRIHGDCSRGGRVCELLKIGSDRSCEDLRENYLQAIDSCTSFQLPAPTAQSGQLLNYLKATSLLFGLIVNFGTPKPRWMRYMNPQSGRKCMRIKGEYWRSFVFIRG